MDHYAKQSLRACIYIRYMDDILIVDNDRQKLKMIVQEFSQYAAVNFRLTLKPPIYRRNKDGQVFLGYKVKPYTMTLSGRSKKRYRSRLMECHRNYENGKWSEQTYQEHLMPLTAFVMHAESKVLRRSCIKMIE